MQHAQISNLTKDYGCWNATEFKILGYVYKFGCVHSLPAAIGVSLTLVFPRVVEPLRSSAAEQLA